MLELIDVLDVVLKLIVLTAKFFYWCVRAVWLGVLAVFAVVWNIFVTTGEVVARFFNR